MYEHSRRNKLRNALISLLPLNKETLGKSFQNESSDIHTAIYFAHMVVPMYNGLPEESVIKKKLCIYLVLAE